MEEAGWREYGNLLYYLCKFSANLKLFQSESFFFLTQNFTSKILSQNLSEMWVDIYVPGYCTNCDNHRNVEKNTPKNSMLSK